MAIRLDNTGTGNLTLKASSSGNWTMIYPDTDGSPGYVLVTDGAGHLTWEYNGIGDGSVTSVNLTAPSQGITVSGGPITTSGTITLALADDLAALEGLASTGFAVRTGANVWAQRSITGTSGRIAVTNGDGVSGSPSIDLASGVVTTGTYTSVTVDTYGRVTAGSNPGTGSGTVTSVDVTSSDMTVTGNPITTSGTINLSLNTILPIKGGTGITSYTLGDTLYSSASNVLSKLAGNTTSTKKFLRQTGTGSVSAAPAWDTVTAADVGLGSVENTALSTWAGSTNITTVGTISLGTWSGNAITVAKGGTGQTSTTAAFNALSPITTTGDIIYGSATNTASRLGIGSTGQVLTVSGGLPVWSASSFTGGTVSGQTTFSSSTLPQVTLEGGGGQSGQLTLGTNGGSGATVNGKDGTSSNPLTVRGGDGTTGGPLVIRGGDDTGGGGGGALTIRAGNASTATAAGGAMTISSGNGFSAGAGGNLTINAGAGGTSGTGGALIFQTASVNSLVSRLKITKDGEWQLGAGLSGGSSGQVLTSNGAATAPTWQAVTAAAGSLSGSTLAAGVTASSLTSVGTLTSLTSGTHTLSSGNLSFTTTGQRILGDFSGALVNRVAFQTTTANSVTSVGILPSGTSNNANLSMYSAADPTNSSICQVGINATTAFISSHASGTGTYLPLAFNTNATERMRIDTSGNLLVGFTSVPSAFAGHNFNGGGVAGWNTTSGVGSVLAFGGADTTNAPYIRFRQDATDSKIDAGKTGTASYLPMSFWTSNVERMRIDTSGRLGLGVTPSAWSVPSIDIQSIGLMGLTGGSYYANNSYYDGTNWRSKTTAAGQLYVQNSLGDHQWFKFPSTTAGGIITFPASSMILDASGILMVGTSSVTVPSGGVALIPNSGTTTINVGHITGASNGSAFVNFNYNGSNIGSITQSTTSSVAYNTTSDHRLKTNVQPMQNALSSVAQLKPVTYDWIAGGEGQGFIAHELQEVVPDCVTGEKDAVDLEGNPIYQAIDTSFLVATLTKAIQEQQTVIESLIARISALEAK